MDNLQENTLQNTPNTRAIAFFMSITSVVCFVSPGRFVVGILLSVEEFLLIVGCTLFSKLLDTIKLDTSSESGCVKESCMCIFIVFFVILFKCAISISMGVLAMQLSFVMFIPAVSTFTTAFLLDANNQEDQYKITKPHIVFCIYLIAFFFLRDVIGYGAITLPSPSGVLEITLPQSEFTKMGTFFATIPGAMIVSAIILTLFCTIERRYFIHKNAFSQGIPATNRGIL